MTRMSEYACREYERHRSRGSISTRCGLVLLPVSPSTGAQGPPPASRPRRFREPLTGSHPCMGRRYGRCVAGNPCLQRSSSPHVRANCATSTSKLGLSQRLAKATTARSVGSFTLQVGPEPGTARRFSLSTDTLAARVHANPPKTVPVESPASARTTASPRGGRRWRVAPTSVKFECNAHVVEL